MRVAIAILVTILVTVVMRVVEISEGLCRLLLSVDRIQYSTCHLFSAPILNAYMVPFSSPSQWIGIFMSLPRTLWTLKRTSFLISIYNEHTDKAIVILHRAAFDIHPARSRDSNEKV